MLGGMEMEEPQHRPAPYKRKGGPLRAFGGGDLFAMILGAGCTLLVCSVRVILAPTVQPACMPALAGCEGLPRATPCDCVNAHTVT